MRGQVVAIISADALAVKLVGNTKTPLVCLALEGIKAPRLGTIDGRTPDEPGAWPALDFTRKLCLAKRVIVESRNGVTERTRSHPNFGPLPVMFGRAALFDEGNKDVATAIVEAGWAEQNQGRVSDDFTVGIGMAQDAAKEAKRGIWGENLLIRKLPCEAGPSALLKKKDFEAIVEVVLNGAMFNVWLMPDFQLITIQLAGVRCPSAKRGMPEPFGMEAKAFSETRLLQRAVNVTLFSQNENGCYVARVVHPKGGDIAPCLLEEGLGEMNNQTAAFLPNSEDLRAAETRAKQAKKNKWKNFDISALRSSRVDGVVVSVKGSNSIEVDDGTAVRRLWLSGCKTPNCNMKDKSEPCGLEAREKLRHTLIGRHVQCVIDYKVDDRPYATIYFGNNCMNEIMAAAGLAQVITTKNNQPSDRIDAMMRAEVEAKQKKLGIHSGSKAPTQLNDLSANHTKQKSGPYLHYLEGKANPAVIEHIVSATRLVVYVPDTHCIVTLNLQGLQSCDSRERIGFEALSYCQKNYMQRDIKAYFYSVDNTGCFIGNVDIVDGQQTKSLEADLLARGFTSIHERSVTKCPHRREMEEAQKTAQEGKIGVWSTRVQGVKLLEPGKVYEVNVTDLLDPITLAIQIQSDQLEKINSGLLQARDPVGQLMKGDLVAAIYDGKVYRAKVVKLVDDKTAELDFIELCILDHIPIKDLRVLPPQLVSIPPQAVNVHLGGLRAFHFDDAFNEEVQNVVWEMCENATLYAHLMYDDEVPGVLLTDSPSIEGGSINSMLLSKGMACTRNMELPEPFAKVLTQFAEVQEVAKQDRVGAWVHGNIGDMDDDEDEEY